jgi:hypothetical protein
MMSPLCVQLEVRALVTTAAYFAAGWRSRFAARNCSPLLYINEQARREAAFGLRESRRARPLLSLRFRTFASARLIQSVRLCPMIELP